MRSSSITGSDTRLEASELVLDAAGGVYHLGLHPDQIGDIIFIAGDPGRIARISERFDRVDHKVQNREFVTHTGELGGRRVSALATGIGTDNIDIVLNELDALVNIDLVDRSVRKNTRALKIIRLGTCGALQPELEVDSLVVSSFALGLDNVMHYYDNEMDDEESELLEAILTHCSFPINMPKPYLVKGDEGMLEVLSPGNSSGITVTAGGFYGPQGRRLRLSPRIADLNQKLSSLDLNGLRCMNYEMETSALYGLSSLMGHHACTVCTVVANRHGKKFSKDHHRAVDNMIDSVLGKINEL